MEEQKSNARNKCLRSKVDYVRGIFIINETKSGSKPVSIVSFLGYSVSKEVKATKIKRVSEIKKAAPPSSMKQLDFSSAYQIFMDE